MIDAGRFATRLTYANVCASLALFIALGGTSYAAFTLPRDSVGARELRADSVGFVRVARRVRCELATCRLAPAHLLPAQHGPLAGAGPAATGQIGRAGTCGPAGADGAAGRAGATGLAWARRSHDARGG